jgi:ribosomal protein S18 acetylase RimI-like enzyme
VKGLKTRDARAADREAVFEFCRSTWPDYGDYVQRVWSKWLRARRGRLLVAELDGTPVGLAKITDFGAGEVWLEGLRVDRRYRRRGVAGALNLEVLRTLKRMKPRVVRFCTGAPNRGSRHIGEKYGFEVAARLRYYWMKTRRGKPRGEQAQLEDLPSLHEFIARSRWLNRCSGLIAEGWIFREYSRARLRAYIGQGRVMLIRGKRGIRGAAIYPYEENDDATTLGFVEGDDRAITTLARNCFYIAKARGEAYCSAAVPSRTYPRLVEAGGFLRKESIGQVVLEHGGWGRRG